MRRRPLKHERTIQFAQAISKVTVPKNPTYEQKLVLEWFLKWSNSLA